MIFDLLKALAEKNMLKKMYSDASAKKKEKAQSKKDADMTPA